MSSLMSMIMSDGGGFQWVGPDRGRDRGWWGGLTSPTQELHAPCGAEYQGVDILLLIRTVGGSGTESTGSLINQLGDGRLKLY